MIKEPTDADRLLIVQRDVARVALGAVDGFALAGSGALREHGVLERPTEDVDLFTARQDEIAFEAAVGKVMAALLANGFNVERVRRAPLFARLMARADDGIQIDVDLGVDWRSNDPVTLGVGSVLDIADAVGNKVAALYSRGEARDYLDVDSIRSSGRFTDQELVAAAAERDLGFDVDRFVQQLAAAKRLRMVQVAHYGLTAEQLDAVQERFSQWAAVLGAGRPVHRPIVPPLG